MKALFFVLNKVEKLNQLLEEFASIGVKGATIMSSTGMAHSLYDSDDHHAFASLRNYLDPKRKESKTIMMIVDEKEINKIIITIEKVVGSLENPDTGIVFSVPVDFIRGISR